LRREAEMYGKAWKGKGSGSELQKGKGGEKGESTAEKWKGKKEGRGTVK